MSGVANLIASVTFEPRHCEIHGDYEAAVLPNGKSAKCPKCFEPVLRESVAHEIVKMKEENARIAANARLAATGIPEKYFGGLDAYRVFYEDAGQGDVLDSAKRYVNEFPVRGGKSFGLIGSTGTGKTHLVAGIAAGVMEKGYSVRFASILSVLRAVKSTYAHGTSANAEEEAIESFCKPDLLVIDDLGVKMESETDRSIIYEIIHRRNLDGKSLAFTSNLSSDELSAAVGDRVISRLCENGGEIYMCQWNDYRVGGAA